MEGMPAIVVNIYGVVFPREDEFASGEVNVNVLIL